MATYDPVSNTWTLADQEQNYTLSASDIGASIVGNALDNILTGNDTDNALDGAGGMDTLIGGKGDDLYVLYDAAAAVVVTEIADEGEDAIISFFDINLNDYANVEHVVLDGTAVQATGTDGDNQIYGNDLANILDGGKGNDTLDGGAGADQMTGGLGDDVYYLDDANDVVLENADEGDDTVFVLFDYSLVGTEIENIELMVGVNATGNDYDNRLTGNASSNMLDGGKGNDTLDGGFGADDMRGGLGDDTFYVDDANDVVVENAGEGNDTVKASVSFSIATEEIEFLILTGSEDIDGFGNDGNNILMGNDGINRLEGGKGHDDLDGGHGADILIGGEGDDHYYVDDAGDVVQELTDEGADIVFASASYALSDNVEDLALTGDQNIDGTGNGLDNYIGGNDQSNILDGRSGADTLGGGMGNDTYVIDAADTITEFEDEGTDTIKITDAYAPTSYILQGNFENLTVTGTRDFTATGNTADNLMTGNSGVNTFTGDEGNDILDGGAGADHLDGGKGDDMLLGGAGNDVMIGGAGNDLYFVDSAGDTVTEEAPGGTFDRVIAKISYVLTANVEYLALENAGGNINGTGNALDNTIFGNDGNNILDGGAGRDQIYGATGSDMVHGGDGDDSIHEAGSNNDMLYGDAGNDSLEGEGGNDLLDGGTGADHLKGGAGNDTYIVDNATDLVTEASGAGIDIVETSASFTLAFDAEVEVVMAVGAGALNLTGNGFANMVAGNAAANVLKSQAGNDRLNGGGGNDRLWGGQGTDQMTGGAGKDVFVFDTKLNRKTNLDKIADFSVRDDSIWLDNAIFKKLGKGTEARPGKLNKAFFTIGNHAKDKNDYLVYDTKKGVLYYDADGSGKGKAVEIATLKKGLKMTEKDFFII